MSQYDNSKMVFDEMERLRKQIQELHQLNMNLYDSLDTWVNDIARLKLRILKLRESMSLAIMDCGENDTVLAIMLKALREDSE